MNARSTETDENRADVVSTVPPEIEETILTSFGHAVIEFEDTLYMKFLHLTRGVVLTKREFVELLENMEERGIVVSGALLGKRCWAMGSDGSAIYD